MQQPRLTVSGSNKVLWVGRILSGLVILFGAYLGLLAWGGLFLRNVQLRNLIPLQR